MIATSKEVVDGEVEFVAVAALDREPGSQSA
jgi:hypothetical protein